MATTNGVESDRVPVYTHPHPPKQTNKIPSKKFLFRNNPYHLSNLLALSLEEVEESVVVMPWKMSDYAGVFVHANLRLIPSRANEVSLHLDQIFDYKS